MLTNNNFCYLSGYISVYSALYASSRKINRILLDRDRFDKVMKGKFHLPEKKQYSMLKKLSTAKGVPTKFVKASEFPEAFSGDSGGIAAEVGERIFTDVNELLNIERPFLAAIDGIEDPYNFGQVLRSFYASAVDGVIVPERNFFTASAVVARASAGASELLKISAVPSMEGFCSAAAEKGIELLATGETKDSVDLYSTDYKRPLCIFLGGERRGISKKVMEKCNKVVRIPYSRNVPMSLSASSAAAVISFEIGRRIT